MATSKNIEKDIVIVGGGASALMCSSLIDNRKVTILEKADRIGKKILVTGNGRCNLTNIHIDVEKYNTSSVKPYLDKFDSSKTLEYFKSLGLETYSDSEGRVYPCSDSANSVLDVLRLKLEAKSNIETICGVDITNISKTNDKYIINTSNGIIECNTLVMAVGGLNGSKYLDGLRVDYKPYTRSLGALKSDKNINLNGVKVDRVNVTLEIGDKKYSQNGEILFKEDAISGIVIFNLSAYIARQNAHAAYVNIDFMPCSTIDEVKDILTIRKNTMSGYMMADYFTGLFHKALGQNILVRLGIKTNQKVDSLNKADIDLIAKTIKAYRVKVYEVLNNNQVYSGGVSLASVDDNLMSKTHSNLYFMGELIDVDAECGGYNLQWAWTSGYVVAQALNKRR